MGTFPRKCSHLFGPFCVYTTICNAPDFVFWSWSCIASKQTGCDLNVLQNQHGYDQHIYHISAYHDKLFDLIEGGVIGSVRGYCRRRKMKGGLCLKMSYKAGAVLMNKQRWYRVPTFLLRFLSFSVFSCTDRVCGQLNRWHCHSLTDWLRHFLILEHMTSHWLSKSYPGHLWPLRHLIRVMRRHGLTKKNDDKDG